jgi:hypothetical protein
LSAYNTFASAREDAAQYESPLREAVNALEGKPSSSSFLLRGETALLLELRRRLAEAPTQPGIYLFKDGNGRVLYIGKSLNLKQRLRSYFSRLPLVEDLVAQLATETKDNYAAEGEEPKARQIAKQIARQIEREIARQIPRQIARQIDPKS